MALTTKEMYTACAVAGTILIIVLVYNKMRKEGFQNLAKPTVLPDGVYRITNTNNIPLTSNIVDTIMCNDFLIGATQPRKQLDWKLKRVAQSVYILYKQGEKECLYTSPADSLRSFYFPSCNTKNLCGLETPNHQGELDGESLRTYFMILQHPSGKYFIKSMKNDMYLKMTKDQLVFSKSPCPECLFSFKMTN